MAPRLPACACTHVSPITHASPAGPRAPGSPRLRLAAGRAEGSWRAAAASGTRARHTWACAAVGLCVCRVHGRGQLGPRKDRGGVPSGRRPTALGKQNTITVMTFEKHFFHFPWESGSFGNGGARWLHRFRQREALHVGTVGPGRKLGVPRGADAAASARAGPAGAGGAPCCPGHRVPPREQLLGRGPAPRPGGSRCPGSQGRVELAGPPSRRTPVSSARLRVAAWNLLDTECHPQTPSTSEPGRGATRTRGPHAPHAVPPGVTTPSRAPGATFTGLIRKRNHAVDRGSQARPRGSLISIYFTKMRIEKTDKTEL